MFLVYPHAHFTALFLLSSLDHTDLLPKTFLTLTYTQEWPHIYLNIVLFIHVLVNCFFLAIFEGEREGKREREGGVACGSMNGFDLWGAELGICVDQFNVSFCLPQSLLSLLLWDSVSHWTWNSPIPLD